MAHNKEARLAIRNAAQPSDFEAARNWIFITGKARNWNVEAQEQFMGKYCEFNRRIEELKDNFYLTYAEISDILKEGPLNEDDKLVKVTVEAEAMLWEHVIAQYPETTSGDLSPLSPDSQSMLSEAIGQAVTEWVNNNT